MPEIGGDPRASGLLDPAAGSGHHPAGKRIESHMPDEERNQPRLSEEGRRRDAARLEREARALRQNLARRKAQQRARGHDEVEPEGPAGDGA